MCAVSYLNTAPLVWGLLHGPQQGLFDLSFSVPSVCADRLACGDVQIGIVPCAELDRLELEYLPDVGIAGEGPVRSILLLTRVHPARIRTLAADTSSRTSVMLARIILAERFGCTPAVLPAAPDPVQMMQGADAALIIGDPALRLDVASMPWEVLDLGAEWTSLTGLPMVFAVWASRAGVFTREIRDIFLRSCRYGLAHLEQIVSWQEPVYGFPREVAREYLSRFIRYELGPREREGLSLFRSFVGALRSRDNEPAEIPGPAGLVL